MKLLKDDVRENLGELAFGKDVLNKAPKAWSINLKIDKLNFIKVFWQKTDTQIYTKYY